MRLGLLLVVLALVWALVAPAAAAQLTVSVIDVGQGDSILVEFPNGQDMLVDAGDRDAGPSVVEYLRSRGVKRIDVLVASHPHADHIGGVARVLAAFPVGKVWDSGYNSGSRAQESFLRAIKAKHIRFGRPKAGFSEKVGGAAVTVLAPPGTPVVGTHSDANNNSLVLRISYGSVSFLLPGDMEREERATVTAWPRSTVLKAAHHGSRNGTDFAFAEAVSPQYAVISCAQANSYGHPHQEALDALQAAGAKILRTAVDGTVVFTTDGKSITYTTSRAAKSGQSSRPTRAGAAAAAATPAEDREASYIGNLRSKVFHRPSCGSLPAEKNRVIFRTRDEAIAQGYRPCRNCNP
jgi:competence protein ComEC